MVRKNWEFKKGFWVQFLHLGLNLVNNIDGSGLCVVYMWILNGIVYYIGKGTESRPINHYKDTLSRVLDSRWELCIIAENLTDLQASILEAKLLRLASKRSFSERGSYVWDGVSLINKQMELTYNGMLFEDLFDKYLNLNDRNWKQLKRKINKH